MPRYAARGVAGNARALRVTATRHYSAPERRWRGALTLALAIYGWHLLRTSGDYGWLDSLDLAIHETGHIVFGFGGEILGVLGGTLLQLLVPVAFIVALWRQGDRHGATVPLWWLGQNCWNIAVYVRDARTQELPLLGGGEHDWALLLGRFGMLERDVTIARAVIAVGFVLYAAAVIWGWWSLFLAAPAAPGPSDGATRDSRSASGREGNAGEPEKSFKVVFRLS
jgi:hypothetical protein